MYVYAETGENHIKSKRPRVESLQSLLLLLCFRQGKWLYWCHQSSEKRIFPISSTHRWTQRFFLSQREKRGNKNREVLPLRQPHSISSISIRQGVGWGKGLPTFQFNRKREEEEDINTTTSTSLKNSNRTTILTRFIVTCTDIDSFFFVVGIDAEDCRFVCHGFR